MLCNDTLTNNQHGRGERVGSFVFALPRSARQWSHVEGVSPIGRKRSKLPIFGVGERDGQTHY